jgi:hypothetical protein
MDPARPGTRNGSRELSKQEPQGDLDRCAPGININTTVELRRMCFFTASRLHRYYEPLRHPSQPGLSLTSCQLIHTTITAGTSRVAHGPLCLHAVANTPAGLMEFVRSYDSISFGLPRNRGGSAPALVFSRPAQRSLTLRPARSPSRLATLCTRGFSSLVASTAALIATGWSEPVPGRAYSRCGPSPFHGAPGNAYRDLWQTESIIWSKSLASSTVASWYRIMSVAPIRGQCRLVPARLFPSAPFA